MLAPQSRQADQTRIIESLARESEFPIDEVAQLYEEELAELGIDARITSFLPIFAIRNVQEALRKRGAARRGVRLAREAQRHDLSPTTGASRISSAPSNRWPMNLQAETMTGSPETPSWAG